jgi:hypothetical protein
VRTRNDGFQQAETLYPTTSDALPVISDALQTMKHAPPASRDELSTMKKRLTNERDA